MTVSGMMTERGCHVMWVPEACSCRRSLMMRKSVIALARPGEEGKNQCC